MEHVQVKNTMKVQPEKNPLKGTVKVPADKSISHRAAIFSALTYNSVIIENFSTGADCKSTLDVLKNLGVNIEYQSEQKIIISNKTGFKEPNNILDAGNSGTTIRLISGLLAGLDFYSVITGDNSLKSRPMARVINPLKKMGANIWARNNDTLAPISIKGSKLSGILYETPIASAQIKSAIIIAGLSSENTTTIIEPFKSRDHTERLLSYLNADISVYDKKIEIKKSNLTPKPLIIPGDISSAAFFIVAGTIIQDSEITLKNIGLNPTRTGIIEILKNMGADIKILNQRLECGEEVGDIKVNYSNLKGTVIEKDMIPKIIDELPIIAVAATQAEGKTVIKDAEDLRHKESDRIKAVCSELKKLQANIEETKDGFIIYGKTKLKGNCLLESYHDHRIAMSNYVAGLIADNPVKINDFNWINISFPEFVEIFEKLRN
ncbi:MAG: 3-phosphoshikimate 1-carboxyvinyltransferase [bacterium]